MGRNPGTTGDLEGDPTGLAPRPIRGWISSVLTALFGLTLFFLIRSSLAGSEASPETSASPSLASFRWRSGPILSLGWSPDGASLAVTYWGLDLGIYEVISGRLRKLQFVGPGPRTLGGWSPDGRDPLLWGLDGSIVRKGAGRADVDETISDLDRSALARGQRGESIRLWGPTDRRDHLLPESARPANSVAMSVDGRTIISGGGDGLVRFIDLATGRVRQVARFVDKPVGYGGISMVAISPRGDSAAACGVGPVRVYDLATGRERRRVGTGSAGYAVMAFSPDGQRLAGATWSGSLRIWDVATGAEERRYAVSPTRIVALTWSPDGRSMATGGFDGNIAIWETARVAPPLAAR